MARRKSDGSLSKKRRAYLRAKLLERRRGLLYQLSRKADQYGHRAPSGPGDEGDTATEITDAETDLGAATLASASLAEVEHALRRLDEGTFGQCEACGEPIPEMRLRAMPFASLCIACKQRQEREGGITGPDVFDKWARVLEHGNPDAAFDRSMRDLAREDVATDE